MTARRSLLAPSIALSLFLSLGCGGGGGGDGGDTTPPTIVSVSPADQASGVARGTAVVVTFSEPVAPASVTPSTVAWRRVGGGAVAFSAGVSGAVVTLTQTSPPLAEYGEYTVQITTGVTDVAGNALPAAQARTIAFRAVDDVAPSAPGTPAGPGAYALATGVAFSWTAASDAGTGVASYWLQVATATDGSGTTIFDGSNGAALSRTVTVADGQTAFARVKAVDGAGNETWSAWSSGVLVDASPPVVSAVSDAGDWSGSSVALSWAAASDPAPGSGLVAGYSLQIATAPDAASVVETLPSPGTSDTYFATSTIAWPEGASLYARVGAADVAGNAAWGGWSDGIRIDRAPPSPSAPADAGAYSSSTSVEFTWAAATDAGSGVASYWLQVATATDGSGTTLFDASNGAALSRTVTVADGQTAFARVKATDAAGNEQWSGWSDGILVDATPPAVPGAVADLGAWSAALVSLSWATASDPAPGSGLAAGYTLEVATSPDPGAVVGTLSAAGTSFVYSATSTAVWAEGATLYARAGAADQAGNMGWSGWSDGIRIDRTPPTLSAVSDAGAWSGSSVDLSWAAASDPAPGSGLVAGYTLQVATAPDPGAVLETLPSPGTSDTYFATSTIAWPEGGPLYARVGATDAVGNMAWGGWSDGVLIDRTGPVFSAAPTDPGDFGPAVLQFQWTAATDSGSGVAPGDRIEVAFAPDAGSVFSTMTGVSSPHDVDVTGFPDGTAVYARVTSWDAAGNPGTSEWSDGVILDTTPPTSPGAPTDGGVQQRELTAVFQWAASTDTLSGLAGYTVQVATAADGTGILVTQDVVGATSLAYAYGDSTPATLYARVLATDAVGNATAYGPWSDGILIDPNIVGTPSAPADGGQYSDSTLLSFSWSPVTGATGYLLEIGSAPGLADVLPATAATSPFVRDVGPAGLPNGTTYYARVAAVDGGGPGGWSDSSDGITVDLTAPGAPGTPLDRGDVDDRFVTFTWTPADDPESGVAAYEVEVFADGSSVSASPAPAATFTYDAAGRDGETITARVRAVNGAGTFGGWSSLSDGVVVDTSGPAVAGRSPGIGQPGVPTNVDIVYDFTEPMDRASVEAAFSLSCGAGCPANGLAFVWNAASTRVTIMPDTADPAGATNADVLPESTSVTVTLAATATDAVGNPLSSPDAFSFSTGDETAPRLVEVQAEGFQSPVPPAETARGPVVVMAVFDEPMEPTQGRMAVSGPFGWVEGWYEQTSIQSAASTGGGEVTYTLFGCSGIQMWDLVTVRSTNPPSFDVTRAPVTAVGQIGGDCTFTVANPTTDAYLGGGSVSYPASGGGRVAWTSPTTLQILVDVSLPPASEVRVEVSSVADLAGNWTWARGTLQVAAVPGTDATAPYLFSASPRAGDSGVIDRSPILLRFSEPMDVSSLTGAYAVDETGAQYEMDYGDEMLGSTLVFVPLRAAPELSTVTVHVPASARDLAGNTLGAPIDLSFEVAARTDFSAPVVLDVNPPSGMPVDEVWAASFNLLDGATGFLELADTTSVGPEDVRVVDLSTGLLVRGWRPRAEAGSGTISLDPPARGGGFSSGSDGAGLVSASASGGVATYVTSQPHGLVPGALVSVSGMSDGCFAVTNWEGAPVLAVGGPTSFTLATGCPDGATATGGWSSWRTPRSFEVVVPAPEGGEVRDFAGNAMTTRSFVVAVTPAPTNRAPTIESLRDLRIGSSTSPLGRTLELEFRVRDPEDDPVTVSVTSQGGAIAFPSMTRILTGTRYSAEYRYSAGGPPGMADPPEMNDANFPTSGYYPFEITVEDAASSTTFVRQIWVWAPSDVPANDGVDDGGTLLPYDATRPVVVETTPSPGFRWQGVDLSNADFLALQVIELTPSLGGQGEPENSQAVPLATAVTTSAVPAPLDPSLYAWFLNEYKFVPGEIDPRTQGWSLDFANLLGNTVIYGPANRSFAASDFGAARTALSGTGPAASLSGSTGLYAIEAAPGTGSAPVAVAQSLTRNDGTTAAAAEWFAAAGDGRFMVTSTDPAMGLPLAYRGFHGRGGRLFAVAGGGQASAALEVGVRRDPALDFSGGIAGTTFAFVQAETRRNAGLFQVGASVGEAVAGASDLDVSLTDHSGAAGGPFPVPYTVAANGLLRLDVSGGAGVEYASGWLGGEAGALMGALSGDSSADLSFFLLMAQRYGWTGTEGASMLAGTYRFTEYSAAADGAQQISEAHASSGVLTFDGAGGFSYVVTSGGMTRMGTGTYAVDPAAERVTLVSDPGTLDETTFLLAVAPDPDTLFGVSVSNPERPQVLVLGR